MNSKAELIDNARERFTEALLCGDQRDADAILQEGTERGVDPAEFALLLIADAQLRIGKMWENGRVNVAHEHLATQIVAGQLARLRGASEPLQGHGKSIVVSAIESDEHHLGAAMVALALQTDGWNVQFLGGGVPVPDLLAFVADRRPEIVGLSVTLRDSMEGAQAAISALRALAERPKILVGGAAFEGDEAAAHTIGADAFAADAVAARSAARHLVGLPDPRASLDEYLAALGERIQRMRKSMGWSQQTLADHTGLTRTYLSSIEQGRRNVSLGALLKIARALNVSPESLLA